MLPAVIIGLIGAFVSIGGYVCFYYLFQANEPVNWRVLWLPFLFSMLVFYYYFHYVRKETKRAEERDREFMDKLRDYDLTIEELNSSVNNLLQAVSKH